MYQGCEALTLDSIKFDLSSPMGAQVQKINSWLNKYAARVEPKKPEDGTVKYLCEALFG